MLLTKTHLYGLTIRPNKKTGMAEITVRHPLSSIIKISVKSSCPEMISFTYGEKLNKSSTGAANKNASSNDQENLIENVHNKHDDENSSTTSSSKAKDANADYDIKGKDWFFVPDYAGEAASAVKSQCLHLLELTQ